MRALAIATLMVLTLPAQSQDSRHLRPVAAAKPAEIGSEKAVKPDFQWSGRVREGQTIEVRSVWGDVHAQATTGKEIEVLAFKRAPDSGPLPVHFEVVPHGGGITICAIYPSDQVVRTGECKPSETAAATTSSTNDVPVDFVVRVPAGVRFIGRTVYGKVGVKSLSGDVAAHSIFGDIEIEMPGQASAVIAAASTEGRIESDVQLSDISDGNVAISTGTIGCGQQKILLNTVLGTVRVHLIPEG